MHGLHWAIDYGLPHKATQLFTLSIHYVTSVPFTSQCYAIVALFATELFVIKFVLLLHKFWNCLVNNKQSSLKPGHLLSSYDDASLLCSPMFTVQGCWDAIWHFCALHCVSKNLTVGSHLYITMALDTSHRIQIAVSMPDDSRSSSPKLSNSHIETEFVRKPPVPPKPSIVNKPPVSKRREELTKAISDARKKIQTVSSCFKHCFVHAYWFSMT